MSGLDFLNKSEAVVEETTAKKPKKEQAQEPIHVVALATGWYDRRRIEKDEKFFIHKESHFSKVWMKKI